jgi:hypothetical protein
MDTTSYITSAPCVLLFKHPDFFLCASVSPWLLFFDYSAVTTTAAAWPVVL